MKNHKICLLALVSACAFATAQAQTTASSTPGTSHGVGDGPTRLTNAPTNDTGTILKHEMRWKSDLPLNKTYQQMSPEEKAKFHAMYQSLPEGDEPPFPEKGLKPFFYQLKKGQNVLQARGELNLAVTVGPDGKALKVDDFGGVGGPNAYEMTNFAASLLLMTKFKPAVCHGQPCTMQFPFKMQLN